MPDDLNFKDLLSQPSSLPDVQATMQGFSSEQDAHRIGNTIFGFLRIFGTFLDLERLEGVTVAWDYDTALVQLDRGFGPGATLIKTHDDFALGIAMTPTVMRNGKPYSRMVINAAFVYCLKDDLETPEANLAIHILAHEAAHVHDLAMQDRAFPGMFGTAIPDYRKGLLFGLANGCWSEYIASRLSAEFGDPERIVHFESTFCSALQSARQRSNKAIFAYRTDHSPEALEKLVSELVAVYGRLLIYGAYLLGHLDGLDMKIQHDAPEAHELIQQTGYFVSIYAAFEDALHQLFTDYGKWPTPGVFDPLARVAEKLLNEGGITFSKLPTGEYWIDVPFTRETTPVWP
ncbi:MAG: hypothetical protein MN733_25060 [Nitrososphaera sp.]|nr:hypothetical protein [Nitrososphaera sp.]